MSTIEAPTSHVTTFTTRSLTLAQHTIPSTRLASLPASNREQAAPLSHVLHSVPLEPPTTPSTYRKQKQRPLYPVPNAGDESSLSPPGLSPGNSPACSPRHRQVFEQRMQERNKLPNVVVPPLSFLELRGTPQVNPLPKRGRRGVIVAVAPQRTGEHSWAQGAGHARDVRRDAVYHVSPSAVLPFHGKNEGSPQAEQQQQVQASAAPVGWGLYATFRSMFEWISVMFAWIFGASRMGAQTHDVEQRL